MRHQKDAASYWLLPGGGVHFGESLETALRREFLEETRLRIEVGDLVLASDSVAPDGSRHVVNLCFTAEALEGEPALGEDPRVAEVRYVDREELEGLALHPDIREELERGISEGFAAKRVYLGARWTDAE